MRADLAVSDELVDELLRTDVLVLGVPMYNFGIPAMLKAYIDQIVRVGRTFAFDPAAPNPYAPLVPPGKRAYVIVSTGDSGYQPGGPLADLNQVEPYLRTVFGFIGIEDPQFVYAGNDEFGGERLSASLAAAHDRVAELAT
jgi:FMN-dependent NADH-azoreductase